MTTYQVGTLIKDSGLGDKNRGLNACVEKAFLNKFCGWYTVARIRTDIHRLAEVVYNFRTLSDLDPGGILVSTNGRSVYVDIWAPAQAVVFGTSSHRLWKYRQ